MGQTETRKKLETDLQSVAHAFISRNTPIRYCKIPPRTEVTRHVNRMPISWRKDNAQKVYSQANAQERSAATLYDLANRESTLRGARATYPNKENRKNRTNLQPRRTAQQLSKQRRRRPRSTRERARGDAGRVAALTMVAGWGWVAALRRRLLLLLLLLLLPRRRRLDDKSGRAKRSRGYLYFFGGRVLVCPP
jgi:hypothetical protein